MNLIVDFISPSGHKNLNKFLVGRSSQVSCLIAKGAYKEVFNKSFKEFYTPFGSDAQGIKNYIDQLFFAPLALLWNFPSVINSKNIIFLSHDGVFNYFIFFILKTLLKKNVYAFEHNTIVSNKNLSAANFIKHYLRLIFSNTFTPIVFEDFIAEYLYKTYSTKAQIINHPILIIGNNCEKSIISSLSGSSKEAINSHLVKLCENFGWSAYIKGDLPSTSMVHIQKNFVEYEWIIKNTKVSVLFNDFSYRVSGVFYESLGAGSYILMLKSIYSEFMQIKHPDRVYTFETLKELEVILVKLMKKPQPNAYSVTSHNSRCTLDSVAT